MEGANICWGAEKARFARNAGGDRDPHRTRGHGEWRSKKATIQPHDPTIYQCPWTYPPWTAWRMKCIWDLKSRGTGANSKAFFFHCFLVVIVVKATMHNAFPLWLSLFLINFWEDLFPNELLSSPTLCMYINRWERRSVHIFTWIGKYTLFSHYSFQSFTYYEIVDRA